VVDGVAFPNPGPLNNPDPLGTLLVGPLEGLIGLSASYNALILVQLTLTLACTWLLARQWLDDGRAALASAVAFGFCPLLLTYGVSSSVIDILNVWQYPLALYLLVEAWKKRDPRRAMAAGVVGGVAFVACPYNAVLFLPGLAPLGIYGLVHLWKPRGRVRPSLLGLTRTDLSWKILAFSAAAAALVAGAYGMWMRGLMAAPESQMSEALVSSTRHIWPYPFLMPGNDRYFSALSDYLLLGKNSLVLRNMGSRFFRSVGPGYGVLGLGLAALGLEHRRREEMRPWIGVAALSMLASAGPYLVVADGVSLPVPANIFWLLPHWLSPGASLVLEPFRYGLPAALGFAMIAGFGSLALMNRIGRWVGWVVPFVVLLGLILVEPVPTPLPVAEFPPVTVLQGISQELPPGAVIRLPYYDQGTARFRRIHFYEQLAHGRSIPDQAAGFPSAYMLQNAYLAALLRAEHADGLKTLLDPAAPPTTPEQRNEARLQLSKDGFVAIIVDPSRYANAEATQEALALLQEMGQPEEQGDYLWWRLP
jgi:hypothetical protein